MTSQVSSETDPGNIIKTYGYTPGGTRLFQATVGNPVSSLNGTGDPFSGGGYAFGDYGTP